MKLNKLELEIIISRCLKAGVLLAALTIAFGMILYALNINSANASSETYTTIGSVMQGVLALKPTAIISLGLLFLIFTPIFRVALSILIFLMEKDYLYVGITLLVFIILMISLTLGKAL